MRVKPRSLPPGDDLGVTSSNDEKTLSRKPVAVKPVKVEPADISMIVCTRNRRRQLSQALESIAIAVHAAHDSRIELVVVDNGSTDGTARLAKSFARLVSFPVIVVTDPAVGLSNARNTGVSRASGGILAFTDDDCRLEPDFFVVLAEQFNRPDPPAILGGRVLHGDPTDAPFSIKTDEQAARLDDRIHPGGFLLGCNMAIRRDVFDTIGLFDPLFGAGAPFNASEETDLIYRAFRAGFSIEYRPEPTVSHFHGRKTLDEIRNLSHGYFVGNGAMYAKHRLGGLWLFRHLLSNIKSAVAELLGGRMFAPELQISYVDLVRDNFAGMMLYWTHRGAAGAFRRDS